MKVEINEVYATEFMLEHGDMLRDHMAEVGMSAEVAPDLDRYKAIEEADMIFTLAAVKDGEAIGYCSMILSPHPHDVNAMCACNDAIYVKPEHRGFISAKLMLKAEQVAKTKGASIVMWSAKSGTDLFNVLERHEYEQAEVVFTKRI